MSESERGASPKVSPILFSAPMIKALIDGTKNQTRRIIKLPNDRGQWEPSTVGGPGVRDSSGAIVHEMACIWNTTTGKTLVSPCGKPGDLLWVREAFEIDVLGDFYTRVIYSEDRASADFDPMPFNGITKRVGKKPSIHMPRWASRLTLEMTDVRVQRLQDISEADAYAEGLSKLTKDNGRTWKYGIPDKDGLPGNDDHGWHWQEWHIDPRMAYRSLWESLHGKGSWEANPWVWVLSFRVHRQNIDALLKERKAA